MGYLPPFFFTFIYIIKHSFLSSLISSFKFWSATIALTSSFSLSIWFCSNCFCSQEIFSSKLLLNTINLKGPLVLNVTSLLARLRDRVRKLSSGGSVLRFLTAHAHHLCFLLLLGSSPFISLYPWKLTWFRHLVPLRPVSWRA